MSRSLLRSVLELRTPITRLPPSFLLPIRAAATTPSQQTLAAAGRRALTTTAQHVEPEIPSSAQPIPTPTPAASASTPAAPAPTGTTPEKTPAPPAPESRQAPLDPSVRALLPLLRAQPAHYVTAHIHGFPYLVTPGDQVRLPFKMPGVAPGDVLRLDRASVLGSRDYTLRGEPWVDGRLFECRAVVLGTESEPLRVKIKTKRRNRRSQRVTSKHKYTVLRISELKVLEDPEA